VQKVPPHENEKGEMKRYGEGSEEADEPTSEVNRVLRKGEAA